MSNKELNAEIIQTIPSSVHFQVGNVEMTNLIVQNEVGKVNNQIETINERLKVNYLIINSATESLQKHVIKKANIIWEDKFKKLFEIYFEIYENKPEKWDQFSLVWNFTAINFFHHSNTYREFQRFVNSSAQYERCSGGSNEHIEIPGSRNAYLGFKIDLDEDIIEVCKNALNLKRENMNLEIQKETLIKSINDTTNMEKKVLAALTKNSLSTNPELLSNLKSISNLIKSPNLLLK